MEEKLCECGAPLIWIEDYSVAPEWVDSRAPCRIADLFDYVKLSTPGHYKHREKSTACVIRQSFNRVKRFELVPVPYSQKMHTVLSKLASLDPSVKVEVILDRYQKGIQYQMFVSEVVAVRLRMAGEDQINRRDMMDIVTDLLSLANLSQDDIDVEVVKLLLEFAN